jgi:hypothetical protein
VSPLLKDHYQTHAGWKSNSLGTPWARRGHSLPQPLAPRRALHSLQLSQCNSTDTQHQARGLPLRLRRLPRRPGAFDGLDGRSYENQAAGGESVATYHVEQRASSGPGDLIIGNSVPCGNPDSALDSAFSSMFSSWRA